MAERREGQGMLTNSFQTFGLFGGILDMVHFVAASFLTAFDRGDDTNEVQ